MIDVAFPLAGVIIADVTTQTPITTKFFTHTIMTYKSSFC